MTPAVSSVGHYAKIVQDTALLRRLIFVAGDIAELSKKLGSGDSAEND